MDVFEFPKHSHKGLLIRCVVAISRFTVESGGWSQHSTSAPPNAHRLQCSEVLRQAVFRAFGEQNVNLLETRACSERSEIRASEIALGDDRDDWCTDLCSHSDVSCDMNSVWKGKTSGPRDLVGEKVRDICANSCLL